MTQALAAILFLYRDVLAEEVPWINDLLRAQEEGAVADGLAIGEPRSLER